LSVLKDNLVEQIEAVEAPLKERWHRLQAAYRFWNLATHHILGFTIKLVLLLYFAFTILFLALRWVVLPNIDHYKHDIESLATRAVGQPVVIDRIYASWKGLRPQLILGDVVMRDTRGLQALHLPNVSATLSWWSVPAGGLRFESLEFNRPEIDVRRDQDGKLYAAGIFIDLEKKGDGKSADWLLSQREVVVREGRITWTDLQRGSPPLQLDNVTALMLNKWRRHQFAFKATPPAALAAPIDVRADFSHQAFTRISDIKQWKGEVYAELRRADLAAWKPYLPGKIDVKSASGGVRAWLSIDHAKPSAITADVALANVVATLGSDLPQLDVAALHGRVSAGEERSATLVATPGMPPAITRTLELKDVSLRTRDGVELAPTTASARHVAAANQPAWTEVKAAALDLKILSELATRLPLPQVQRDLLAEAAPRGRVSNLVAEWRGPLSAAKDYKLKADLEGLGMEALAARPAVPRSAKALPMPALPNIPGFENLSGHVEAGEQGGSVAIDAPDFTLSMPAWFDDDERMSFEQLKLNGSWSLAEAKWLAVKLDQLDLVQHGMQLKLAGSHVMPRGPGAKGLGQSDLNGTINNFTINRIGNYLPKQTPEHLRQWLTGALEEGTLNDTTLRLRGDLSHFPFKEGSPDKAKGEFRVAGRILDGKLNYSPGNFGKDGRSPLWPQAEKIRGTIVFERARMEIKADTATTLGVGLSNVKAVIPDLTVHNSMLEIDGNAAGAMQDFLKYVAVSPVLEWIGHFTDETTATGNARLALKLQLPLAQLIESKVQGSLALQGNEIVLWHDMPNVSGTTGKIEFNEKGVNLNNLAGTLLGGPLSVTGGSQKDGSIQVRIGGNMTVEGLRKQYPTAAMQRVAAHLGGGTKYTGLITAREHKFEVVVDSSMQGASFDFPAPLKKGAAEAMPLRFQMNGGSANEQGVARDDIRVTLGNSYAARYHRQRVNKGPWKLVNGGIGVNVPAPEPDSGLMINVNLKSLNVDDWIDLAAEIAGSESKPAAQAEAEGFDVSQFVVPETMAAHTAELIVGERKLDNVVVGTTHSKGVWQASIDSQQVVGYVTWNESPTGKGVGKVTARLSSLVVPESQAAAVKDLLESSTNAPTIPALDIEVQRLEWFNRPLGQLELHAYNALITSAREWRISKLSLINADGELSGTGRWQTKDGQHNTSLNFNMDINNAGKLLERFGFADTLRNGKGKLSGDIAWKGLPYHMDLPSLSGTLALNVEKGQFLKQDPGAAKLLGVLSLQALPRLLKLDFNDVFSEGLQFDGITANATINHGIVKTDNLKMHGVQATVLMDGTADIVNESTNLRVVVIPQVNLGTAPLVYALAVNPVIGLGSYLAQLFLSAPVMKALTYQMQVTGPWKAPVITKIENAKEPAP
jgi:uncharacterized protein (TIGR02099 family)